MRAVLLSIVILYAACAPIKPRGETTNAHHGRNQGNAPTSKSSGEAREVAITTLTLANKTKRDSVRDARSECGADALVATRGERAKIVDCKVVEYRGGNHTITFVDAGLNAVDDCPSGCMQRRVSHAVMNGTSIEGHHLLGSPGNPYYWVGRFLDDQLGLSQDNLPNYRYVTQSGSPCVGAVSLIVRSDTPYWQVDFGQLMTCKTVIVSSSPGARDRDFSLTLSGVLLFGLDSQFERDTDALKLEFSPIAQSGEPETAP